MNFKYKDIVIKKGIEYPNMDDLWLITKVSRGVKCDYYYTIVPLIGTTGQKVFKSISDRKEKDWINAASLQEEYPEYFI